MWLCGIDCSGHGARPRQKPSALQRAFQGLPDYGAPPLERGVYQMWVRERMIEAIQVRRTAGTTPSGVPLPPVGLRQGGQHFSTNENFVRSGVDEAARLGNFIDLNAAEVLDLGCGAGRLAVGLREAKTPPARYIGVEVQRRHVRWCSRHLGDNRRFTFVHQDAPNERYNPGNRGLPPLPAGDDTIDLFYAFSVLSHMRSPEVSHYLKEAARVLRPGGAAAVTAFVEDDVPDETENPAGYGPMQWDGPLHCVRYSRPFFLTLAKHAGLALSHLDHGSDTDGQSFIVLEPSAAH